MTIDPQAIAQRSRTVYEGAGRAVEWVTDVRSQSARLDSEADGLIERLRQSRNLCRRLGAAALRPASVGVFGMSQAGKSYLISSLARDVNGQLETDLDGNRLNFIKHINPPGGGKEATGLVTRFTRRSSSAPSGFPVRLTIFSEVDLAKVLGNSYFHDFDRERVELEPDLDAIRIEIAALQKQRLPNPAGGVTEDDMVDLLDYFEQRFEKSMAPLRAEYWPSAVELAPRLDPDGRARLLSILWGGIEEFTRTYSILSAALRKLSHASTIHAPLEALVSESGDTYEWSRDSILNVDVLDGLCTDTGTSLEVLPINGSEILSPASIPRAVIAALTVEMEFSLANEPVASMLERVDLLDFPGYRGRLNVARLEEVEKQAKSEGKDPVAQLFLRGKVAYLFERYTEDQEMNVLLMCTRCDIQIEVTTLAPVLSAWVHGTQGGTPEERAGHPPGLVWVLTQLDRRLEAKPGQSASQQEQEWSNMMHITLLERFAHCDWLDDWSRGEPFRNVCLVRKPGMLRSTFRVDEQEQELEFLSDAERSRLQRQKSIFVGNHSIGRYVRDAADAWDAVLTVNDGGMTRLAQYLDKVASMQRKLERIEAQVSRIIDEIGSHRLDPYFQAEGAGEVEKKRAIAERVSAAVRSQPDGFGELLYQLQPSSEKLRTLYLHTEATTDTENGSKKAGESETTNRRRLITLPGTGKASADKPSTTVTSGRAATFARAVASEWIRKLREIPDNPDLFRFLGLPSEALQALTDELITGFHRCNVEDAVVGALRPLEEHRGATRRGIVDQQVLLAKSVVSDFVDYLGYAAMPVPERPKSPVDGRRIFEPAPPIASATLPALPAEEQPYSGMFIVDWLAGFGGLAVNNAGHSAGREITPEQNERLGEILSLIRGPRPKANPV